MHTSCLVHFLLLSLATALPYGDGDDDGSCNATPSTAYRLEVRRDSHNHHHELSHELWGKKIEASAQGLYIGLNGPSTYCPSPPVPIDQCPAGKETVFAGLVSMDVEVPGGQMVYVDPAGVVGFTQAHSAFMPVGSTTGGFAYCSKSRTLVFKGMGFLACPDVPSFVVGATHRVYAKAMGKQGCVDLGGLKVKPWTDGFGAWQYT
ncbi:hypothetical protein GP486_007750 [Trichoglossum hirsutum]|uniref:Uncharacterized protein n=1 Tax=Trichoglossum hirsutum TaxID=265104 RepID=A0A9P8L6P7_9PEZI|nr:hypothetical protein GP486_007750 [Trichoglossum hirsutum]